MKKHSDEKENRHIRTRSAANGERLSSGSDSEASTSIRLRTLDDIDGRTRAARIAKELVVALESDLGGDLTAAQRELVKRAALLGAIVGDAEAAWLERRPTDLNLYGTLADRQRRILEALGLRRVSRDVTPSVDEYLRKKREAEAA